MPNIKCIIAYDGKAYQGFQKNKNAQNTIQIQLNDTLSKYFDESINCIASGRTDKGVHALGQVINFHTSKRWDGQKIKKELNHYLPEDIVIQSVKEVEEKFHSRFHAKTKVYKYRLWKGDADTPPLFERHYMYVFDRVLDVKLMREGAIMFLGEHDFKGFSSDKSKKSTVRTITRIDFVETDNEIVMEIEGTGFLYNMVRIIMGTLIEIGLKEREITSIEKILKTKLREKAGYTVPAKGLSLVKVNYS